MQRVLFLQLPPATLAALLAIGLCAGPAIRAEDGNNAQPQPAGAQTRSATTHWAFQPLRVSALPRVHNSRWIRSEIDRFTLAHLEQHQQPPVLEADARTWIRRVTFDLIGLPPTPAEIDAFLRDSTAQARSRVVERLLASTQYGERWGRHWLDLVRYADTSGDSADYPIPEARKYRDYVIAAFNQDKPYDQFIQEQLAGDLMPSETREQWREQIIATGFVAISRRFGFDPTSNLHLTIEDTLDTTGRAVLGLSLSCARCHDHKYDPISMEDYYGLYGIFASTRYPHPGSEMMRYQTNFIPLIPWAEVEAIGHPYLTKVNALDEEIARIEKEMETWDDAKPGLAELKKRYETLWDQREDLVATAPRIDAAYGVYDADPVHPRIQERGNPYQLGREVPRAFLHVLGGNQLPTNQQSSGRLELAGWLTAQAAPLTARVMVNRIWQHHFDWAIVDTPSDFGLRGSPPKDAALLDYLAQRFIDSGWSIKDMHRLIVLSATYAQAASSRAQQDPQWAPVRRRLEAEEIRDALLAVSGELDPSPGGDHPFPHPSKWNYTQHLQFMAVYPTRKRSVYLMQQRLKKHPFMSLFDGADTNVSTAAREESITPLQALFVMNDPLAHDLALKFAERLGREHPDDVARIDWAHQLAFGRSARPEELQEGLAYLRRAEGQAPSDAETNRHTAAWESYARALLGSNEFFFVE